MHKVWFYIAALTFIVAGVWWSKPDEATQKRMAQAIQKRKQQAAHPRSASAAAPLPASAASLAK